MYHVVALLTRNPKLAHILDEVRVRFGCLLDCVFEVGVRCGSLLDCVFEVGVRFSSSVVFLSKRLFRFVL